MPRFFAFVVLICASAPAQESVPWMRRFRVDPGASEAGFDGTSTLHDFTGRTKAVSGEVRFDPAHADTTAGGTVSIEAATLDTDNKDRDVEMRKLLETGKFPRISFTLDALKEFSVTKDGRFKVEGRFGVRGTERIRGFEGAVAPGKDGTFRIKGDVKFKLTDHGIDPPGVLFVTMGDEVRTWFDTGFRPVEAKYSAARFHEVEVVERNELLGSAPVETSRTERLWIMDDRLLWERSGNPVLAVARGAVVGRLDARRAVTYGPAESCDAGFRDSKASLGSLKKKLDALPPDRREALMAKLKDSLARLEGAAGLAPADGEAEVVASADATAVGLGGVEWISFGGLVGDAAFPGMLTAIEGLPLAVRKALATIKGIPATLRVRAVTPAGARVIRYVLKPAVDGRVPDWLVDPSSWTVSSDKEISW